MKVAIADGRGKIALRLTCSRPAEPTLSPSSATRLTLPTSVKPRHWQPERQ